MNRVNDVGGKISGIVTPPNSLSGQKWTEEYSMKALVHINECVSDCHKTVCGFKLIEMEMEHHCEKLAQLQVIQEKFKFSYMGVSFFHDAISTYIKYGTKKSWELELFSTTISLYVSTRKMLQHSISFIDLLKIRMGDENAPMPTPNDPLLTLSLRAHRLR